MRGRVFVLAAALAAAASTGRPQVVRGDDAPAASETTFLADLARVNSNLSVGSAETAMKMLLASLEANRDRDYVIGKRAAIEDLTRRICFRTECPLPPAQSVVKGKLRKFVSFSGAFEIAYTAGQPNDFEARGDGSLFFPVHFRGPYTITVKGDEYTGDVAAVPRIQLGSSEDPKTKRLRAWLIGFGVPPVEAGPRARWVPPRIVYVSGDDKKQLAELPAHPAQIGRPYRLDASVTTNRVTGSINGTSIGSAPKTDGEFGVALIYAPGWREIVISGLIEPSWIQGKLDAAVDGKRKAFDASFDAKKLLPAWVFEASKAPTASAPDVRRPRLPAGLLSLPSEHAPAYVEAVAMIASGRFAEALTVVASMRTKGAPDAATGVLAAQALWGLDEPTKALVEVERAVAIDGGAMDALLLKARILCRLGRDGELVTTIDAIRSHTDAGTQTLEAAGTLYLLAGRLDDARKLCEGAARGGVRSQGLERLARVVVRAQSGPEWTKTYEYKTSNYDVLSDIDADTCQKAALALEDALIDFRGSVKSLQSDAKRQYRVYLFSGRTGFDTYISDANSLIGKVPDQVAGLYSPILKQLLIWNLPNRDEMFRVIRHEGFHQYLDRLLPDPPVWFNEGLAVYFEGLKRVGGTLRTNLVRDDLLRRLSPGSLIPMAEFVRITPGAFYGDAARCYPEAWLVAHLLRQGAPRHAELYRALLARLETAAGSEAVRATFDDATLRALDADLAAHLAELTKAK